MENSYFSKELGGYMDTNLLPDLGKLSKEGYNSSDLPEGFGGNPSSTGANWAVASMVNMSSGLPMKVPVGANAYGLSLIHILCVSLKKVYFFVFVPSSGKIDLKQPCFALL